MTCNFRVGQKVECIDDTQSAVLRNGQIYTVIWFSRWPGLSSLDGTIVCGGLRLAEAEPDGDGFDARRFRPVVERGTEKGMSILRDLLNKTGKPVEVVA